MLTHKLVFEIFEKRGRNINDIHNDICHILKINKKLVNKKALYIKIKRGLSKLRKLKGKKPTEYKEFEKKEFKIPIEENPSSKIKPSTVHSTTESNITITNLQKKIISLKEQLRAIKKQRLSEKIKRKDDIIRNLRRKVYINEKKQRKETMKEEKIENQGNVFLDKGVQCNTFKTVLKDLERS